jgi:hypothetical protein
MVGPVTQSGGQVVLLSTRLPRHRHLTLSGSKVANCQRHRGAWLTRAAYRGQSDRRANFPGDVHRGAGGALTARAPQSEARSCSTTFLDMVFTLCSIASRRDRVKRSAIWCSVRCVGRPAKPDLVIARRQTLSPPRISILLAASWRGRFGSLKVRERVIVRPRYILPGIEPSVPAETRLAPPLGFPPTFDSS